MKRSAWFVMVLFLIPLFLTACEQKKTTTPPHPQTESQAQPSANVPPHPAMPMHEGMASQTPKTITVPEEVAGKWESVVIRIEDKTKKTSVEQTIPLHTDYQIPGSSLIIKVGDFPLPLEVPENGAVQLGYFAESKETWSLLSYGRRIGISRQALLVKLQRYKLVWAVAAADEPLPTPEEEAVDDVDVE